MTDAFDRFNDFIKLNLCAIGLEMRTLLLKFLEHSEEEFVALFAHLLRLLHQNTHNVSKKIISCISCFFNFGTKTAKNLLSDIHDCVQLFINISIEGTDSFNVSISMIFRILMNWLSIGFWLRIRRLRSVMLDVFF